MKLSPHEMAWCLKQVGFTGVDAPTGLDNIILGVAIGLAESKGDTDALGVTSSGPSVGNRDHGVWQISGKWHGAKLAKLDWRDPLNNAKLAKQVWDETVRMGKASGWEAWSTYTGSPAPYAEYLAAAKIAVQATWPPVITHWLLSDVRQQVNNIEGHVIELPDLAEILAGIKALKVTIG